MAQVRPPKSWQKVGPAQYGSPVQWVPDGDVYALLANILSPDAPELIMPGDEFTWRSGLQEALNAPEKIVEITPRQGKIIGRLLFGDGLPVAGMYWRVQTVESLGLLRAHMLIEPWPVRKVGLTLGLDHGYVAKTIRQIGEDLARQETRPRLVAGRHHATYLRDLAMRGLQKQQLLIGRRDGYW